MIWQKVIDPPYIRDASLLWGRSCPLYHTCRLSDAQFAHSASDNVLGRGYIARTTSEDVEGLEIDLLLGWRIAHWRGVPLVPLAMGDAVTKVGKETGTTNGLVYKTCTLTPTNLYDPFTGLRLAHLCQYHVKSYGHVASRVGDSGAPVFTRQGGNQVIFEGLLSSGMANPPHDLYSFSPYDNIRSDLKRNPSGEQVLEIRPW